MVRVREERTVDRDIDEITAAWILADEEDDPDDLQCHETAYYAYVSLVIGARLPYSSRSQIL